MTPEQLDALMQYVRAVASSEAVRAVDGSAIGGFDEAERHCEKRLRKAFEQKAEEPGYKVSIYWTCKHCAHQHHWRWDIWDATVGNCTMKCDVCGRETHTKIEHGRSFGSFVAL